MAHTENTEPQEEKEKSFFSVIIHSFFVIPFLIAVFCVLLFTAVHLLTSEQQTVYDFLNDVKVGGATKRWQAAFELSKILANPELIPKDERFVSEMISAFKHSEHDDSRVRQYLALAMGRTGKSEFLTPLTQDIESEKEENLYAIIYALGMLRDKAAVQVLSKYSNHANPRIRSGVVVSLGVIGDYSSKEILKKALNDSEPNVKWGASLSLAHMKDASGKEILAKLLNRKYLSSFAEVDPQEQNQILLAAIEGSAFLEAAELDAEIKELAQADQNMKVRAAAMDYVNKKINKK
ncbi:MAG: hypothetical protein A2787_08830 [Omnitrophica WOR_2 bacterium RIFCSPHIGHO2_01_FULL_48_9]|nr:MAG: hypothetical protein A3D10_07340 [Omnitrophica WOR_2 bacterium RIFCSPHIGHO2_02_FULL_48_11]OGX30259.1 MAG: hypothetical protein A2787_08830 [Omnitrophica WOR_2 bacterium RIFCSPHIGHO2_01_FULL_48_9]